MTEAPLPDGPPPAPRPVEAAAGAGAVPTTVPASAPEPPATAEGARTAGRPRRGRRAAVVLAALLVLTVAAGTYLYVATTRWQASSEGWETDARSLGQDVSGLRADLDGATAELTATREQLTKAEDRIDELADEKAQLGDDNAASAQGLGYQQRVSAAAGKVALALDRCVDGQSRLIGYLDDRASYDAKDLARYSDDVDALCDSAKKANDQLQDALDG
ncbi:hypothetical protein [Cellulomonas sp. PhB143]|uniref:hypothetical protein n=1 Tax=Cellulomonas sp. PhB143 TaxID=2485186 RepID=UPI000FB920D6|nr:hypothetical protein [Cellulomonas sp. PhB143]ROS77240.1 hypothetical protein EDF32_1238 [Cellulomonas sp. PhB143]